jgi:hypothetical protein
MFKAVFAIWIVCVLGILAVIGGVIYIALHFLAKVW